MARVIPISDDPHYADFAEFVHTEEGPVETFLREDVGEKWQFRALFMAAALAFVLYGIPAIVRACQ